MPKERLSPEKRARVKPVYEGTRSQKRTADELGTSMTSVRRQLIKENVPMNRRGRPNEERAPKGITREELERDYAKEGATIKSVARDHGVSSTTMYAKFKELGIDSKSRGPEKKIL